MADFERTLEYAVRVIPIVIIIICKSYRAQERFVLANLTVKSNKKFEKEVNLSRFLLLLNWVCWSDYDNFEL